MSKNSGSPVFDGKVLPAVALLAGGAICRANRTAAIARGVSRQILESQKSLKRQLGRNKIHNWAK
jgi:hypothetical protein